MSVILVVIVLYLRREGVRKAVGTTVRVETDGRIVVVGLLVGFRMGR